MEFKNWKGNKGIQNFTGKEKNGNMEFEKGIKGIKRNWERRRKQSKIRRNFIFEFFVIFVFVFVFDFLRKNCLKPENLKNRVNLKFDIFNILKNRNIKNEK